MVDVDRGRVQLNLGGTCWNEVEADFWADTIDLCLAGYNLLNHYAIASLPTAGGPVLYIAPNKDDLLNELTQ
jgi:hypothetical protein